MTDFIVNCKSLNLKDRIQIFSDATELAKTLASEMAWEINNIASSGRKLSIALSGGSTPKLLFSILADYYSAKVNWNDVHLFWGDERCVSPDDPESNYGVARKILFDKISLPAQNIFRIIGENDPLEEAERYSSVLKNNLALKNGWPVFDMLILGMGEDGHTASIFPGREDLFSSEELCAVATHPLSGQKRITMTGKVINNSQKIIFLVSGKKKAGILSDILAGKNSVSYPAAMVKPVFGDLYWYVDWEAAERISKI
jgi:6-phosphogluconolactonase